MLNSRKQNYDIGCIPLCLRLLVVDDSKPWLDDLQLFIGARLNELSMSGAAPIQCHEIKVCETSREARQIFESHAFHGATLDQRLPDEPGSRVTDPTGLSMAKDLQRICGSSAMSFYTAYPGFDFAEQAGQLHIPYKLKAVSTESSVKGIKTSDYAAFFISHVLLKYISQVLYSIKKSGFALLRDTAHEAFCAYDPAIKYTETLPIEADPGFAGDDDATKFLVCFFQFQERFLEVFAGFTYDIARFGSIECAPPANKTSAQLEDWVGSVWDKIECEPRLESIKCIMRNFYGLPEEASFSSHFISAFVPIRQKRNDQTHNGKICSTMDFVLLRPAMFRILDLAALLARLPMIHQPRRDRTHFIAFNNLNAERSARSDMLFRGEIPSMMNVVEPLYTILPGSDFLIPLGKGLRVVRDAATNRPTLSIWKEK
jgi:hypothetical protein